MSIVLCQVQNKFVYIIYQTHLKTYKIVNCYIFVVLLFMAIRGSHKKLDTT